jgi:SAM-dependent methyltransferase
MTEDPLAEMLEHYQAVDEGTRLTRSAHGRLEFLRTQSLLRRFLPAAPARVLDVGGATGIHATWLSEDGYEVDLINPTPHHVEIAGTVGTFRCREGDARHLDQADDSIDAVLLLGPLYHLIDRENRLVALREALRVLRPGGLLAAAGISRYLAALEVGTNPSLDPERIQLTRQVIATGRYEPLLGFTAAHWHRLEELRDEVHDAGFNGAQVFGIEGPSWPTLDAIGLQAFDTYAASAVAIAELLESDSAAISMSAHLLAIATA